MTEKKENTCGVVLNLFACKKAHEALTKNVVQSKYYILCYLWAFMYDGKANDMISVYSNETIISVKRCLTVGCKRSNLVLLV